MGFKLLTKNLYFFQFESQNRDAAELFGIRDRDFWISRYFGIGIFLDLGSCFPGISNFPVFRDPVLRNPNCARNIIWELSEEERKQEIKHTK